MKLAVLLYGQPRFWDLSYESIIQETTFENSTTDYYFHFWDKIAYHSDDPEYQLTEKDKNKIIAAYKPKKYLFTDYSILEKACEDIYKIVEKNTNKIELYKKRTQRFLCDQDVEINLNKSIFEITNPTQLRYYLGQFVSLEQGASLIKEEYDYIFRIRTDVLFATSDLYDNKSDYTKDKQLFYHRLHKKEKGIFCRFGDLQIWEGATDISDSNAKEENHQPKKRTSYDAFLVQDNKIYAKQRATSECDVYNPQTQYLHMKDWYILGSGNEMLQCMSCYMATIKNMIDKSRVFVKKNGIDINWATGEVVCGEVLGLHGINAGELGFEYIHKMIIPQRLIKIANKHTKQCILDRHHIRVLSDSDISLKEQYKKIINE